MDPFSVIVALVVVAAAGFVCAAAFHVVPGGHHGVVTRAGVPVRTRTSGIVAAAPGFERVHLVPLHPAPIDPLVTHAVTRDGVEVQLVVSVLYQVTNPAMAVVATPDARGATADAVERAVHHLVAQADLATLLRTREAMLAELVMRPPIQLERAGVELIDVDLLEVEVRVGAQLLHLLDE